MLIFFGAVQLSGQVVWHGNHDNDFTWNEPGNDSFAGPYSGGDDVLFTDIGVGVIAVGSSVEPGNLTFTHTSGTYTFLETAFSANGDLTISGGRNCGALSSDNNAIHAGANGRSLEAQWTSNASRFQFSGSITGSSELTLFTTSGFNDIRTFRGGRGLVLSGDNSGFSGSVFIESTAT